MEQRGHIFLRMQFGHHVGAEDQIGATVEIARTAIHFMQRVQQPRRRVQLKIRKGQTERGQMARHSVTEIFDLGQIGRAQSRETCNFFGQFGVETIDTAMALRSVELRILRAQVLPEDLHPFVLVLRKADQYAAVVVAALAASGRRTQDSICAATYAVAPDSGLE